MRKQKWVPCSVVRINLGGGSYGYGQLLQDPLVVFFDAFDEGTSTAAEVAQSRPLFAIHVMKYSVTDGDWTIIGRHDVPKQIDQNPFFFMEDIFDGTLYITRDGVAKTLASKEDVKCLESLAVWEPEHVRDRLNDYRHGRPNEWVEQLRPGKYEGI
jgi:hypothetical protein